MSPRALSPVVGTVLLTLATVVAAGAVGVVALDTAAPTVSSSAAVSQPVVVDLRVDADADRLTFVHRGGEPLDVRKLTLRIEVDGTPLSEQPPVPFFSAGGFRPGPTGPFNSASDSRWEVGETASVAIAGTNDPELAPGVRVVARIAIDGVTVAEVSATA